MLTLHCRVLGSFPSDAAYAFANYGQVNRPCLGFFLFPFPLVSFFFPSSHRHHIIVVMVVCVQKIKSCNLNHRFYIVHQEFKYAAKGLNTSYKFC